MTLHDHEEAVTAAAPPDRGLQPSLHTTEMRRILASGFIGSAIEFYDFILYGTAASIVFNRVYFTDLDPAVAIFASFVTLAVGYVARPIGGVVFGHFGDRVGRKRMLVLSMLLMGVATTLIGVLPTTAQIGVAAPVLLVLLRLVQGIAVGGEWGGAALMALEHAPTEKRGFATSFASAGGPAGALLATLVVTVMSATTGEQFLTWGWRVPFLLSAALIAVGLVIRLKVTESPLFQQLEQASEERKVPIVEVLRHHRRAVGLALVAALGFPACQGLLTVWGVSMAVENGVERTDVLVWKAAGAALTLAVTFASARLSDRFGRRRMLVAGATLGVVCAYPLLTLLTNGTLGGFAVAIVVGNGLVQGMLFGPLGAFVAEQFPTRVRYTGASLAYQGGSTLGAGFSPMIAAGLIVVASGAIWPVALFWAAILAAVAVAVLVMRESSRSTLG
ncbi:MFS transporter [Isoptericola sp. BMS4]|uniref:MFS transporter n=1 Tax=Isoptericola sp. BMS4 TaxID=2527875 RepID=UPI001F0FCF1E|nr:MFS transporter [Isoptericola sp. BMS4]